jgi:hypothetical protein
MKSFRSAFTSGTGCRSKAPNETVGVKDFRNFTSLDALQSRHKRARAARGARVRVRVRVPSRVRRSSRDCPVETSAAQTPDRTSLSHQHGQRGAVGLGCRVQTLRRHRRTHTHEYDVDVDVRTYRIDTTHGSRHATCQREGRVGTRGAAPVRALRYHETNQPRAVTRTPTHSHRLGRRHSSYQLHARALCNARTASRCAPPAAG